MRSIPNVLADVWLWCCVTQLSKALTDVIHWCCVTQFSKVLTDVIHWCCVTQLSDVLTDVWRWFCVTKQSNILTAVSRSCCVTYECFHKHKLRHYIYYHFRNQLVKIWINRLHVLLLLKWSLQQPRFETREQLLRSTTNVSETGTDSPKRHLTVSLPLNHKT